MTEDIEYDHFLNVLAEDGEPRDLIIELNVILQALRDLYGVDLSRRSALELRDNLAERLSDTLEELSYYDEVVAAVWKRIPDHDLTGDYIPPTMKGGFFGLDQIGQVGEYWYPTDVEHE